MSLLSPGEVAEMFAVNPKTVTRWANQGRLPSIRTPGGHRRFRRADVERLVTFQDVAEQAYSRHGQKPLVGRSGLSVAAVPPGREGERGPHGGTTQTHSSRCECVTGGY